MQLVSAVLGALCISGAFAGSLEERSRKKVHLEHGLWPKIVRYTNFSSASFIVPCTSPPYGSVVVDYININSTDTQATLFRSNRKREFVLAFPGSVSDKDFQLGDNDKMHDYNSPGVTGCHRCQVHAGFLHAWNSAADTVLAAVAKARAHHPTFKLVVTGHSLGAALACLAYSSLNGAGQPVHRAYTYGQPRVGNPAFADHIDGLSGASVLSPGNFYRVTHTYDGVPQTPPARLGFRHSRTEYWELDTEDGRQSARTTYRCFGQEPEDCNASRARGFTNAAHGTYSNIYLGEPLSCGVHEAPYLH